MNSHNHPMMGSVGSWFYKYLLGITPSIDKPGFAEFMIKPYIPTSLDSCSGSYLSIRGAIKSAWNKKSNGRMQVEVGIPGNSTATVYVPATSLHKLTIDGKAYRKRSEEHTSELQSLMRISYAVFCLKNKKNNNTTTNITNY